MIKFFSGVGAGSHTISFARNLDEFVSAILPEHPDAVVVADEADLSDKYTKGGELRTLPVRPSPAHVFDVGAEQWVDPRSLDAVKAAQWTLIKQARTDAIDAPLVTPFGTFDSGPADRANITDAVLLANNLVAQGQSVPIEFTLEDNTSVELSPAQMVAVGLYLGSKVQAAHAKARTLRAAIQAAGTSAEVAAVVW